MLHPCSPFVPLASLLTSQVLNTLVSRLLPIFFHVKTYSLFALYLKNRVDFFLETERKKISIFFFPFSFLPPRRELSSTRTQTQYVISRKLKNETYVVSNVNAFHGHVRSLESSLRPHRCYIIPMKARAFKSTISISFIGDLSISLHLSN